MVGDILRRERERQKLSIKDIEQGTSIRALYIEAIENGDYDKLPGNVYTKGFIKNYGNFLKLNGEDLSRQFSEEVAPAMPIQPEAIESNAKGAVSAGVQPVSEDQTARVINEPIPSINNQAQSEPEIKINSPKLAGKNSNSGLITAAAVLIIAVIGGLWYYFTNIEGKELAQNPPVQTQSATDANTPTASATPVSTPAPDSVTVPSTGVNLQAKFVGKCWTKVVVDGRVAYEGTAEAGQTLSWQGKERIAVTAGNAGAVEFIENGSNLGIAGADGDVIEKVFTRK